MKNKISFLTLLAEISFVLSKGSLNFDISILENTIYFCFSSKYLNLRMFVLKQYKNTE